MIKNVVEDKKCTGCYCCKDACPAGAIELSENEDGFREAGVNDTICIQCGKCLEVCPVAHDENRKAYDVSSYAFRACDEVRKTDSSGGVVPVAASVILQKQGVVCGVQLTPDLKAQYIVIDQVEDIAKINGSKYIQADATGIYRKIKTLLLEGKTVLFTGLPCQTAGLYNYLKGCDQSRLYTIDMLCHGTPSDKVFREWLSGVSEGRHAKYINFRVKDGDWNCNTVCIEYEDGSAYRADVTDDWFEKLFHYNMSLRKSCYHCKFAEFPRRGDLSTGDFHGIEDCQDIEDDHKGTSVIFVNSDKGQMLLNEMKKENVWMKEISVEDSKKNRICADIEEHPYRDRFFRLLREEKYDFANLAKRVLEHKFDIGIVGIPTVENHGSNLSYYGLYRTLQHMGYDVFMMERPKSAWWAPHETPVIFRENPYDSGDLCELFESRLQLQKANDYADTFILGSDQLWYEGLYACFDKFCFMDYIHENKNKITYAASFGRSEYHATREEKAEAAFYIQGIDHISVREESAVELCRQEWNREAVVVLDPVFLCPTEEYEKLADKGKKTAYNQYIATYILDPSPEKQQIIEKAAQKLELPVINMTDVVNVEEKCAQWDLDMESDVSNEDWLRRIRECTFFITDSFHGTCFALIFEKQFLAIGNAYRGLDRFTEILGKVGLKDHLVSAEEIDTLEEKLGQSIAYDKVRSALQREKEKSGEWLKNAICAGKENRLSGYDIIQKERMKEEEQLFWQKNMIDAHGNVLGAHDTRLAVYDGALGELQKDAEQRRILFEIQQKQMQEFQDAILQLRQQKEEMNSVLCELQGKNQALEEEIRQIKEKFPLKRWAKRFIQRFRRR